MFHHLLEILHLVHARPLTVEPYYLWMGYVTLADLTRLNETMHKAMQERYRE